MSDLGNNDPSVIGLVTAGLTEVKDAVAQLSRDLHGTLNSLPNDYVPRREVERRMDEMTIDIAAEKLAREHAIKTIIDAAEKATLERATHWRWIIGLGIGTIMSGLGVLSGLILHFT
jgi:hypothetical protein